ncbi:hypothetical protein DET49_107175 [Salegentibacter sp. 24]|nr:hypothetical protein DET49_107175 [Salegentibacter sp. 24]
MFVKNISAIKFEIQKFRRDTARIITSYASLSAEF